MAQFVPERDWAGEGRGGRGTGEELEEVEEVE